LIRLAVQAEYPRDKRYDLPMTTPEVALPKAIEPPAQSGTMIVKILRTGMDSQVEKNDRVAVEAPLEYMLHHPALGLEPVSFGTTMRTPGDDESLAAGLLYGEGIVNHPEDIEVIESSTARSALADH
jgi:formate dehydrogenase assembly factor FdhD